MLPTSCLYPLQLRSVINTQPSTASAIFIWIIGNKATLVVDLELDQGQELFKQQILRNYIICYSSCKNILHSILDVHA